MSDTSLSNRPSAIVAVTTITVSLVVLAFAFNYPSAVNGNFFSDCATYYALATSLAHDFDIEYSRADIQRIYADFSGGPAGLFLQRNQESNKLYYGKAFIYPLFVAPAVRLFGTHGILFSHAILFGLTLLAMTSLFNRHWGDTKALLISLAFLLPTTFLVFYFWIAPELFNFTILFFAFFFLIYKEVNPPEKDEKNGFWRTLLLSEWSDVIGLVFIGLATYSKLSNGIYILPALAFLLIKQRWKNFLLGGIAFAVAVGLMFGTQLLVTGEWNYQGGERKQFTSEFPFANQQTFESTGISMQTNVGEWEFPFFPVDIAHNISYFFVGRFGGILPYFFPTVLALILFIFHRWDKWIWRIISLGVAVFVFLWGASLLLPPLEAALVFVFPVFFAAVVIKAIANGPVHQSIVLAGIVLAALTFIVLVPTNVIGGGGTVANRYFMNIMPLFFFLFPIRTPKLLAGVMLIAGFAFMGHILINPIFHSRYPSHYGTTALLKKLPVEYTMLNDLPMRTDSEISRMEWFEVKDGQVARDEHGPVVQFYMYHFDRNAHIKEPNPNAWYRDETTGELTRDLVTPQGTQQMWTVGGRTAEMVLRTGEEKKKLQIKVTNSSVANNVRITAQKQTVYLRLEPREQKTIEFDLSPGFVYHYLNPSYLYTLVVSTSHGISPRTEDGASNDYRYLGVMLEFKIE